LDHDLGSSKHHEAISTAYTTAYHHQTLTMVFLLELIVGAKEFKAGFSGMSITTELMASNMKVSFKYQRLRCV
jgi:hypothetical protein